MFAALVAGALAGTAVLYAWSLLAPGAVGERVVHGESFGGDGQQIGRLFMRRGLVRAAFPGPGTAIGTASRKARC